MRLKILSLVGARPNFIKIAPLCSEFQKASEKIDHILVDTGQHYDFDMSRKFFESLAIPEPDIQLKVGSASHAVQTAKIMMSFEPVCLREKPDWVVVVGDVNSTLAGALTACKLGIGVAHVEAGLRSFDRTMPEEINRKVTDGIADVLFTHSAEADANLKREGVDDGKIKMVGNIMIDTLVRETAAADARRTYERWNLAPKEFIYVTLHRPSNVDELHTLSAVLENLAKLATQLPVVFPLHPRTNKRMEEFGLKKEIKGLYLTEPLPYHDSINLAKNARFVLTDSGGLQEETTFLGTPCLTLRPNTERPITITHGTNRLTSLDTILKDAKDLLKEKKIGGTGNPPPLWDGKTAGRIVDWFLGSIR